MKLNHYRKSLITILLFASVPGLVTGFVIFLVSKQQIENELQKVHRNQLYQTARTIDEQFSYLERSAAHWAFDSQFTDNLKDLDFAYRYNEIHDIYRTLLVLEGSAPLVEQVELYVHEPRGIIFTNEKYSTVNDEEQAEYTRLLDYPKSQFWTESFRSRQAEEHMTSVSLVHKIPGIGTSPYAALIMHLNKERVLNLLGSLTPYNQGTTFLFNEAGNWLFTTTERNQPIALDRVILDEVLAKEPGTDTFLLDWEKETYSVTYGSFSRMGSVWYYASAAPLSSITAPVIFISKFIIVTSLAILLFAWILSWFASRRLYSPMDKLLRVISHPKSGSGKPVSDEFELIEAQWNNLSRESQTLQSRLDRQLPHLREGFLLQLLNGYMFSYSEDELRERMAQFGREVHDRRYCFVLIQLLGFSKLEGRFSEGDEGLITFAASNMFEELMGTLQLEADVVNFHDLTIGILLSLPDGKTGEVYEQEIYRLAEDIIASTERILRLQAALCITRTTDRIKSIPQLFEETKLAASWRSLNDSSQIIDLEKLENTGRDHVFDYPFDLEKQVLHSIRIGKHEEAVEYINRFVRSLSCNNANEAMMKQGTLQLLGSILHVVLQSGLHAHQVYEGANLYEQLCQIREPHEVVDWFDRKVIFPFIREFSQRQNVQMRLSIEKVIDMLRQNYKSDISLDSCADAIFISPYILSKMFKEVVGINFIDYLTQIRLEKARELLRDTDWKISTVAEEVGYQHSYFNRLFKKQEGITPGQYREMSKAQGEQASHQAME